MKRIYQALLYSLDGIKFTIQSEKAFREELAICVILIPTAIILDVSIIAKILMINSLILVLIAELINTAIEVSINRISKEKHPLSKHAKDIGSSVVLLAILNSFFTWVIILIYRLFV